MRHSGVDVAVPSGTSTNSILTTETSGPPLLPTAEIEAYAEDVYRRADVGDLFADPLVLATRNDFLVWPRPFDPPIGGIEAAHVLLYRPGPGRRESGERVFSAFARCLLARHGATYTTADVCAQTLALMAPRYLVRPMLRGVSVKTAVRLLVRRQKYAPVQLLRKRLNHVFAAVYKAQLPESL